MVEKGGRRVTKYGSALDSPFAMVNYPDVTHGDQFSFLFFSFNNEGDFVISVSVSAHLIMGGHASAGFNVTEFIVRLFD